MNKTLAKVIINLVGVAFIAAGVAAVFLNPKIIAGALILISAGVSLLCRKAFFIVYIILFVAFVAAGVGLIIAGLAVRDMLHGLHKLDMLLIGLAPVILSSLIIYFFTRHEVAEEFGFAKISILEKVDKKELIATARVLLWIAVIIGVVLLVCYLVARLMAR